MGSEDPISESANLWMRHTKAEEVRDRPMPAYVQALAAARKQDPEQLAGRIPADTLRRLKFPMVVHEESDGTTSFTHDKGIVEGDRALLATDRTYSQRRN